MRKKCDKYTTKPQRNRKKTVDDDDEVVNRVAIWYFYYFVAATIVPLLVDFVDVAKIRTKPSLDRWFHWFQRPPEECICVKEFKTMISYIDLLTEYDMENDFTYQGRTVNFEWGDTIPQLLEALHKFVNLLPYLNDRHFKLSEKRFGNSPRHCEFKELCNLDKTIAKRILPTLRAFANMTIIIPNHFRRMYLGWPVPVAHRPRRDGIRNEWDLALAQMVRAWTWILEREPSVSAEGWEEVPLKIYHGLHLFAEYLPEMQSN